MKLTGVQTETRLLLERLVCFARRCELVSFVMSLPRLPLRPTQLTLSIRGASRCSRAVCLSARSQSVKDACAKTVSVSSVQGGRKKLTNKQTKTLNKINANHIGARVLFESLPELMCCRSVEKLTASDRSRRHPRLVFMSGLAYYINEHNDFMKIASGLLWLN